MAKRVKYNENDYLSQLSDGIACNIVSRMPLKAAARLSTMSKRLRRFLLATKMEFIESDFDKDDDDEEEKESNRHRFIDFVRGFFYKYDENVVTILCLVFSRPIILGAYIKKLISFAIKRNVKKIVLDFNDPKWLDLDLKNQYGQEAAIALTDMVYNNHALEYLELFSCGIDDSRFNGFIARVSCGLMKMKWGVLGCEEWGSDNV